MHWSHVVALSFFVAAPVWGEAHQLDDAGALARQAARCSMMTFIGSIGDDSEKAGKLAKNFMLFSVGLGATEEQRKGWASEFFSELKKAVNSKKSPEMAYSNPSFISRETNACIKLLAEHKDAIKNPKSPP